MAEVDVTEEVLSEVVQGNRQADIRRTTSQERGILVLTFRALVYVRRVQ